MWSKEEIDILISNIDGYVKVISVPAGAPDVCSASFTFGVFVFRAGASTTLQRLFLRCPKRRGRIFTALWLRASTGRCSPSTGESYECTTTETTSASESGPGDDDRKHVSALLLCQVRE